MPEVEIMELIIWGCGGLSKGLTGAVHSQPLTASAEGTLIIESPKDSELKSLKSLNSI